MLSLDMRTIIFSFVLINIVSTLIVLLLWINYRKRYKGLGYWICAFSFQMVAYILIILRGVLPLWVSIDLANAISVLGILLGYMGLQAYTGIKISQIPNFILLIIFVCAHTWFNYLKSDLTMRYLIISIASLIFFVQCAWLMLVRAPQNIKHLTKITGLVFIAFSVVCIVNIAEFFVSKNKPVDYFQSDTFEAIIMIGYQMLIIILTFSITLMFSKHFLEDIKNEEEKYLKAGINDITERKKYQVLIQHEHNLLRTLIDNLPDPVTIKDFEGHYLLNNYAHLQVIGAESQEEVLGKTAFDFFPEKDAMVYDEDDKNVMRSGKMILDKIERAEHSETGFPYWHLTSKIPIRDSTGNSTQILTISHDITDRKRAEDALKESAELNRSLLRTIPFGMDIVDEEGIILFQNENFRNKFGSDATGKKCWEIYRDDKKQCKDCPLFKGIEIGSTEIYESHDLLNGKIFDIYYTGMMFHGKKAMLEIFHDITERKLTEIELIKSKEKAEESDRLKTAFLHNISHEIRTPMNAIVGFSNLLNDPELSLSDHHTFTEIIIQGSNHLLSIVNDIIEIANVESGILRLNLNKINLNDLFNNLHTQFGPKAAVIGIEFIFENTDSNNITDLRTDRTKLIQILSNLLSNAFKFTSVGKISFGYNLKDNYIEFQVSDTGIGIPADHHSKIFDRFYQVDNTVTRLHEGTGLGLSISKAYVELLGGTMWLSSEPGKGSVFYFTLPYENIETRLKHDLNHKTQNI